jgi:hypothetical protein
MTQTFRLKKGQISFAEDKIFISDNGKRQKYLMLSSNVFWLLFGIINTWRFYREGDQLFYFVWIVLVILILLVITITLFSRSTKSLILLDEIKSLKVKKRFDNTILDIKLKNNQLRRVLQIEDIDALKVYIEKHFDDLTGKRNKTDF